MPVIVVVGAGVSGLTSAYMLSKNSANTITVISKHMPGDYDIEYTSPWAGANYMPMATEADSRWERRTWPELKRLATEAPEAGIHFQKTRIYRRQKDIEKLKQGGKAFADIFKENPWYKDAVDDFRELDTDELPKDMASGCEFGSVCINTALYLPWLVSQCTRNGVVFRRGNIKHISNAASLSHTGEKAKIIINATALGARKLGGVLDSNMIPIRGQVVVVRNESQRMVCQSGTDDDEEDVCYVMTRAAGGGTILGGTYQKGNWDSQPDPNVANRIMQRAINVAPELTNGQGVKGLDIVRHGVGLRPFREGGVRIEKEKIDETWIVHNYGHAGWGYQGSYGCAERVVELVKEIGQRPKL